MNDVQREAVFLTEGPLLILAGAGSGKTTVLVNRISNIVKYGQAYYSEHIQSDFKEEDAQKCAEYLKGADLPETVRTKLGVSCCEPWRIMAITFTNKAAGELKDRLCSMLGESGNDIWASTFHSSCARMLRRDADRIGYTNRFTIYDVDDSKRVIKECLRDLDIAEKVMPVKAVMSVISRAKDSFIMPEQYLTEAGDDFRLKMFGNIYTLYQKKLRNNDAMDFDDLLANTVRLFKECPDVIDYYRNRFRYIMVDEYQDTNHVQYEFIRLLSGDDGNLCVVGDDDQSIYKFRGATIENILNFEKDFKNARVIRLEQNYRSTQNILSAANSVIKNNEGRKGKNLWTDSGDGDKIVVHVAENEQDEAYWVAKNILDETDKGRKFSDFSVLYRMNSQSLMFERMFTKHGIPYRIIGGTRFYERQEIKDMTAYLAVINNPYDSVRLRRIVSRPRRGIGDKTIDSVIRIAEVESESLIKIMSNARMYPDLSRAVSKLEKFAEMMNRFIDLNYDDSIKLSKLFETMIEETGYFEFLRADDPERAPDRIENVGELLSNIQRYEEENEEPSLSQFLEEVALFTDIDNYDASSDAVVMMTIHSAKGLEFPVVYLPGWEEGVFPGNSAIYYPEEVEEERRLAYVAITRAREKLTLLNAETRMIFGQTNRNKASRFIEEIPEDITERSRTREILSGVLPSFGGRNQSGGASASGNNFQSGFADKTYKPAVKVEASTEVYMPGDQVMHKTFGQGLVVSATPIANDTLLEIAFDKVGTKKIMANFARLSKNI